MILGVTMAIASSAGGEPDGGAARTFPTAEQVSRKWLTRHPRPRDEAERRIVAVMDQMQNEQARGMGNVHFPQDARGNRKFAGLFVAQIIARPVQVGVIRDRMLFET